jgi:hypothetical protein
MGIFSVKSAYHLQKKIVSATCAKCSSQMSTKTIWKALCNLKIPNVEKHFLWRASHEILPTRDNLCRRNIITDSSCPICGREVEIVFHILWQCPSAMDVWSIGAVTVRSQKCSFGVKILSKWLRGCSGIVMMKNFASLWGLLGESGCDRMNLFMGEFSLIQMMW